MHSDDPQKQTIAGTNIPTQSKNDSKPHIKDGYVKYRADTVEKLSNYMTTTDENGHPSLIKDCPSCGGLNCGRVILVENTDHKGRILPQFVAVGEHCVNDHCNHRRPQ